MPFAATWRFFPYRCYTVPYYCIGRQEGCLTEGRASKPSARQRALGTWSAPRATVAMGGVCAGRGGVGVFLVRCDVADDAHAHARGDRAANVRHIKSCHPLLYVFVYSRTPRRPRMRAVSFDSL